MVNCVDVERQKGLTANRDFERQKGLITNRDVETERVNDKP